MSPPRYPKRGEGLHSPSLWIALLALFIALGGTTYAVSSLPRDSVGTAQLRDKAVTEDELGGSSVLTGKLANGAVTNRKIARGTITGSRLFADTLGGAQIDESLLGSVPLADLADRAKVATRALTADKVERVERALKADSADTATLAERATQADRATEADHAARAGVADQLAAVDLNIVNTELPEGFRDVFVADCDPGLTAVGGGYIQTGDFEDIPYLSASAPESGGGWAVIVVDEFRDTGEPIPGNVYAICVNAEDQT